LSLTGTSLIELAQRRPCRWIERSASRALRSLYIKVDVKTDIHIFITVGKWKLHLFRFRFKIVFWQVLVGFPFLIVFIVVAQRWNFNRLHCLAMFSIGLLILLNSLFETVYI